MPLFVVMDTVTVAMTKGINIVPASWVVVVAMVTTMYCFDGIIVIRVVYCVLL